jgi:tetratricopeptide (TPR) repeat protein
LILLAALVTLNGCAYYNGMYNANRLAGRAEKAERDGRTFDASSFWGQVVVKADSVLARHGDSKWADDARLLRGKALARLGRCEAAIPELARAQQELVEPPLREEASLELARCRLQQGDAAGAQIALAGMEESADSVRRDAARALLGRARVASGDYAGALGLLGSGTDSTLAGGRLVALAGAGRLDEARALADTLIASGAAGVPWGAFLREVGKADPATAAAYLDRIGTLAVDPAEVAGWMLEDANRRMAADPAGALERLHEAEQRAPDSEAGTRARELRLRLVLAAVRGLDSLEPAIASLRGEADDVPMITAADGLLATAELVQRTADSASTRPPHGDLMLFLAGELARDSLRAPALAADLMRRVAIGWPESPYAPKALLAVMALDEGGADAARVDLESRYGASPYVAVTQGIADSTYHALEDSLGSYAVAWLAAARTPARSRSTVRPSERRPARPSTGDPETPGRRREPRPAAGVAEP